MIDQGHGRPLVLIPGIQGRCEWMGPTVAALARHFRVLSFSLDEVPTEAFFDACVSHVDGLLAGTREPAVLVGVSFGGLVAAHLAARRPEGTSHLVLVSTPGPRMRLDPASARYARRPALSLPLFAVRGAARLMPELRAGLERWPDRLGFAGAHLWRVLRYPMSPRRMAAWVDAWARADLVAECRTIVAPTLIVTGEPSLDRVVPVASSLEYLALIPGARHEVLPRTGHIGLVMRPEPFASLVEGFVGPVRRRPAS